MLGHLLKPEKKPEKEDKKMSDSGSDVDEDEENKKGKGEEESKEKSNENQGDQEDEEEDRMLVFKDMNGQLWQISKVEEDIENFDELLQEAEPEVNYFKPGTTN